MVLHFFPQFGSKQTRQASPNPPSHNLCPFSPTQGQLIIFLATISSQKSQTKTTLMMVVQSSRIASCRGNSTSLPSSEGSQQIQSNSNATTSPTNFAAHNILVKSLAKRNRTAQ